MAYVLGFFAADGNLVINKRGGQFWSIEIKDRSLLQKIKKIIDSHHKISIRIKTSNGMNSKTYRLQIGSKEMCEDLRELGIKENKTYRLALPKLPDQYLPDFVRGYFDGDGHVWMGIINKERKTPHFVIQTVFTSCSDTFLQKIKDKLEDFGISKGTVRKGRGNYFRLIYSINGSLKLYDFMYNKLSTSKLFLKRKKDIFEKYIKMRV